MLINFRKGHEFENKFQKIENSRNKKILMYLQKVHEVKKMPVDLKTGNKIEKVIACLKRFINLSKWKRRDKKKKRLKPKKNG